MARVHLGDKHVSQDDIDNWNNNLGIDLDGVLTNGNRTHQRMVIGTDIRFRPQDDDGNYVGRNLEAVLGDGTFKWDGKQYGNASAEFITTEFVNNVYFAAGEAISGNPPIVLTSNDRHNWVESDTSGIYSNINGFTYGSMSKKYVAVADGGHIYYSSDS